MTVAVKQSGRVTAGRLFDTGSQTLDAAVVATWQALAVRGNGRCLACGETVVRADDGSGRCTACHSTLE